MPNKPKDEELGQVDVNINAKKRAEAKQRISALRNKALSHYQQLLVASSPVLPSSIEPLLGKDKIKAQHQSTVASLAALQAACLDDAYPAIKTHKPSRSIAKGLMTGAGEGLKQIKDQPLNTLVINPIKSFSQGVVEQVVQRLISINGLFHKVGNGERAPNLPSAPLDNYERARIAGHILTQMVVFGGSFRIIGRSLEWAQTLGSSTSEAPRIVGFARPPLQGPTELRRVLTDDKKFLNSVIIHTIKRQKYYELPTAGTVPTHEGALSNFLSQYGIEKQFLEKVGTSSKYKVTLPNNKNVICKKQGIRETLAEIKTYDAVRDLKLTHLQLSNLLGIDLQINRSLLYLSEPQGKPLSSYFDALSLDGHQALEKAREALQSTGLALGELHTHGRMPLPNRDIAHLSRFVNYAYEEIQPKFSNFPFTSHEVERIVEYFQATPGHCSFAHGNVSLNNFFYDPKKGLTATDLKPMVIPVKETTIDLAEHKPLAPSIYELAKMVNEMQYTLSSDADFQYLRMSLEQSYCATGELGVASYRFFRLFDYCQKIKNVMESRDMCEVQSLEILFQKIAKEKESGLWIVPKEPPSRAWRMMS